MFFTTVNPPEFWEDDEELDTNADDGEDDYYDWLVETYRFKD